MLGFAFRKHTIHKRTLCLLLSKSGKFPNQITNTSNEIGSFNSKDPFHIIRFTRVAKGTSGAISFLGTIGSILGSITIGLIGYIWNVPLPLIYLIVITGSFGSLVDSFIGGSIQANFECVECSKSTEKRTHCSVPSSYISGIYYIIMIW